ncbi:Ku protein (plasmid) [Streptomyces sp. P9-2B-2]|uniref:non-homologous end joining protein Ku n=1 Tax=Streptomyces sp. P9-2B-2 TaxID=3057114 RepID=UPI0025B36BA2|nr:Ku protein [Streptomyces sp. P9-2B-2]WJY43255.1 Ku protein [Streptomyces sp. P9-2B-2]
MEAKPPMPMRTVWRGAVSFGLVAVPVRLVAATEEHRGRFREMHSGCGGRIRHKRVCEVEGPQEEISYADVGRAVELPDGGLVPITDEDLERLPLPTRHVAEVLGFVPGTEIDPISYGRAYYAAPEGPAADRPYVLLTEVLARTGYVGICKIALRQRERLAVLRPRHGVLVLQTLLWSDEVREPGDLGPSVPVTDREMQVAERLLSELTGIEMQQLEDEYGHALEQLVAAKTVGSEVPELPTPQPAVDLLTALEQSVQAARRSRQ